MANDEWPPGELVHDRVRLPRPGGLRRPRLMEQLTGGRAPRLLLVVAPAGCGKTTLLAHVAEALPSGQNVAWVTIETSLSRSDTFLRHLRESFGELVEPQEWASAAHAVEALAGLRRDALLVLDELHTIESSPAAEVVGLLLRHQPERLRIAIGARRLQTLEMQRVRLAGSVREIGANDLRFRTWEVDELFRTCHGVRLGGEEVSALARRTAGWAAGLQLFHLATDGRPPSSRRTLLAGGLGGGRLTSHYLAEQVLAQLRQPLCDFVLRTSVLSRLTPERCDALLSRAGSAELLLELERSDLVVSSEPMNTDLGGTPDYRYHDVLQTHLLEQLEVRFGRSVARELHRGAAAIWRTESAHTEAVRSFCRAEEWDSVREVIQANGADLAGDRGSWLELVPRMIHEADPWVSLALARRLLADGDLSSALEAYDRAVSTFGGLSGTDTAAREQRATRSWLDPPLGTVADPLHHLRLAVIDPGRVREPIAQSSATWWCAHASALLVSGRLAEAAAAFEVAVGRPMAPSSVEALGLLGQAVALTGMGHPGAPAARRAAGLAASAAEVPVVERVVDGLVRLAADVPSEASAVEDLVARCRACNDGWGEALLRLLEVLHALGRGQATRAGARHAGELLDALPAPALTVWARAAEALAGTSGSVDRAELGRLVRDAARVGPLPQAMALLALARADGPPDATALPDALAALASQCGMTRWLEALARSLGGSAATTPMELSFSETPRATAQGTGRESDNRLKVCVLGSFGLVHAGEPVPLHGLRPLHRELLRLFCALSEQLVRREQLIEWFWAEAEPQRAHHSLQVALSVVRRHIQPVLGGSARAGLVRDGTHYRLQLTHPDDCDARRMENHVALAGLAVRHGDRLAAVDHLSTAVAAYRGELLPEDACAEWAQMERERLRGVAAVAFERLVSLRVELGQHAAAADSARAGLAHDPTRDALWRHLVGALNALDQPVAAAAALRGYDVIRADLGVGPAGR